MARLRRAYGADAVFYALATGGILGGALLVGERFAAPAARRPPPHEDGRPLPVAGLFSLRRTVKVSPGADGPRRGTAFSVDPAGLWLTAGHVVAGCGKVAVSEGPGRAAEAQVLTPGAPAASLTGAPRGGADVAVLATRGGAPALPLADDDGLRVGQRGFHLGFPGGRPGEATSLLLGRRVLEIRGRGPSGGGGAHQRAVLSWAEAGRTLSARGGLAGLSGAPVLDDRGRVVGLTLASAPRRGRLYTAPVSDLRAALVEAGARTLPPARAEHLSARDYGPRADALRRRFTLAEVFCLDRS